MMRNQIIVFDLHSLPITHYSLLVTRYSLLVTQCINKLSLV